MIGERVKGLPEYSKAEVGTRDDPSKSVWVTYGNGVYDITSFIDHHPGAKNILMAAGGSIEPFWDIYAVHKGNAEVLKPGLSFGHFSGNLRLVDLPEF